MFYHLDLNRKTGQMYCRASGLWDVPIAKRFREDLQSVGDWQRSSGKPMTILTDLTDLFPHPQDVAPIVGVGAQAIDNLVVERYAMVVPTQLMRIQVRRIDPRSIRQFFATVEEAANWLGWREFVPVSTTTQAG